MNKTVIASLALTNNSSLNIYDIIHGINDKIEMGINNLKARKYTIYSNTKGSYFNYNGNRYYLNEFMKL